MARMKFGAFLAPHHPIGEHPTLLFQRDLELAEHLDRLGYDEFWVGEHRSGGWETIGSPELFLAAAGQRTSRIKLGTGVISLPYHHPYNVAQRIAELDHLTRGRAMLGVGPGALIPDAWALGIDPSAQRPRMDEAMGVILQLLKGDKPVTHKSDWFELNNAYLQVRPLQEDMPICAATAITPSGMKVAGKYGLGVLSIASHTDDGLRALPTQWGFGQTYAKEHGQIIERKNWRVVMQFHIAPTREQALAEVQDGMAHLHNEYNVGVIGTPGARPFSDARKLAEVTARSGAIGTPEDAIHKIRELQELSGGFGVLLGTAHDHAPLEARLRSWDMFARYVIPKIQGLTLNLERSAELVTERNTEFHDQAKVAMGTAIREHNEAYPHRRTKGGADSTIVQAHGVTDAP